MSSAGKRRTGRGRREKERRDDGRSSGESTTPSLRQGFWLPPALTLALVLLSFVPRVRASSALTWSFWGAALALLTWQAVLFVRLKREPAGSSLRIALFPHHYVQAAMQLVVFVYWSLYWRPVSEFVWLLVAQLVFAYAFSMLLAWSRRETYALGFGPVAIIFSTNLFLWFRDDWFYLQFLLIAVGFLGKEFVQWHRDGRSRHIFNPSGFSLGIFSVLLIATGTTSELTLGEIIASTQGTGPHMYGVLFLVGLVVMYRFSVTLVAGSAAATLFGLSALYTAWTGVPYFVDSEFPAPVFLGLLLLITDPSTSPKEPLGKLVFGGLYGVGVFALYAMLARIGAPLFYDKLLCVPLLNLSVRRIDSTVRFLQDSALWNRWVPDWAPARSNLVHLSLWIVLFGSMTAMGRTDGTHQGDRVPFWLEACDDDRRNACDRVVQIEGVFCADDSGWSCNELGGHYLRGEIVAPDSAQALSWFARACRLRFQAGCVNLLEPGTFSRTVPKGLDLRLLLREGGQDLTEMSEPELYTRACEHGWTFACDRVGRP